MPILHSRCVEKLLNENTWTFNRRYLCDLATPVGFHAVNLTTLPALAGGWMEKYAFACAFVAKAR